MPAPYIAAAQQQLQRPVAGSRCGEHDGTVPAEVAQHHWHPSSSPSSSSSSGRCCSAVVQRVRAPARAVWSVVRRFGEPQAYKSFVRSCAVVGGDGGVGTLREVRVVSGLPAARSTERLEVLDDHRRVLSFRVVGGDHRLRDYRSVTTVHPCSSSSPAPAGEEEETLVVESYVVEVPAGNTAEDTRTFVDTIVRCNLLSLARTAEKLAAARRCP